MFSDNLAQMRRLRHLTQEDIAETIGVSRQAVAKWESGETMPDLEKARLLAEVLEVSLDELTNYESADNMGISMPPRGKHIFGVVTVGDKGQVVIPAKARKIFGIQPGDQLVALGDENQGIALIQTDSFLAMADLIRKAEQ